MNGPIEIVIEADGGVYLDRGDGWHGLRVRYRAVGTRRWSKFILVADGQSLLDLLSAALAVVSRTDDTTGALPAAQITLDLSGAAA